MGVKPSHIRYIRTNVYIDVGMEGRLTNAVGPTLRPFKLRTLLLPTGKKLKARQAKEDPLVALYAHLRTASKWQVYQCRLDFAM